MFLLCICFVFIIFLFILFVRFIQVCMVVKIEILTTTLFFSFNLPKMIFLIKKIIFSSNNFDYENKNVRLHEVNYGSMS